MREYGFGSEQSLWEPDTAFGELEAVRPSVVHGVLFRGVLWRLGGFCPRVTFPSGAIIASDPSVVSVLRDLGVPLSRVANLVVSLPELDWRDWDGQWSEHIRRVCDMLDVEGYDRLLVPYGEVPSMGRGEALTRAHLSGLVRKVEVVDQPDAWLVNGKVRLEQVRIQGRGTTSVRNIVWGALTHQFPWLAEGRVCVEGPVRDILDGAAYINSVRWRRVPVVHE